ncbi:MAG: vWA domain-containing protein [Beijerinckiaceae bacterium]
MNTPLSAAGQGRLADNLVHFTRALRVAGLPVGPGAVIDALHAVEAAHIGSREDFFWTLHAIFVKKRDHSLLFRQAFHLFWRRRAFLDKLIAMMSPVALAKPEDKRPDAGAKRVADALSPGLGKSEQPEEVETQFDAKLTVSEVEILRKKDFAQMTAEEIAEAKRLISRMTLPRDTAVTRRFSPSTHGRIIDPRRTFRQSLRGGGGAIDLAFRKRSEKHPPVIALCDISGSMAEYTRLLLHFLHALGAQGRTVHTFLFATRLTNVTRELRHKDPDEALDSCTARVMDWEGGTRMAACLHAFNKFWSRRVMTQGPTVLFFSDGLEREVTPTLQFEMDRLHRSSRRLVWLNPLLRYDGFEAKAVGIRLLLPHVDEMRPIHNIRSMRELVTALMDHEDGAFAPQRWLRAA